jgi:hypothetical protein
MIMSKPLLVLVTLLQLSTVWLGDIDGSFVAATNPSEPPKQPWLLLAAIAMWVISFFLLHQAARFHVWVAEKVKVEGASNPLFGFVLALVFSLLLFVLSVRYLIVRYPAAVDNHTEFGAILTWYFFNHPSELAAGLMLGSIPLSAIATYTFAMAGFIMRDMGQEVPPLSRSPRAAVFGTIISCISFAGSIAGLIRFFFWLKEP